MMRWYPQLARSVVYPLNTSKKNPRKFFLYNHDTNTVEREFDTSDDCAGCFDLSPDGQLLAVKYWHRRTIDFVDTASGMTSFSCGPSRVWELAFDRTGTKLLAKGESGMFVCALTPPHPQLKIGHAKDICDGCLDSKHNQYWLPSRRKGQVILVRFGSGEIEHKTTAVTRTIKCIRQSPTTRGLILLDTHGTVYSYNSTLGELEWQTTVKPVPDEGHVVDATFSGNGELIGLAVVHNKGCNTVSIDARDGAIAGTFLDVSPGRYPFDNSSTLSPSGQVLDLATGHTSDTFTELADY